WALGVGIAVLGVRHRLRRRRACEELVHLFQDDGVLGWRRSLTLDDITQPADELSKRGANLALTLPVLDTLVRQLIVPWVFELANHRTRRRIDRLQHGNKVS